VPGPKRHIWLCADDYGISASVNAAIRDLIVHRRINATSVMTAAPHFDRAEVASLKMLNADVKRAAIGLHVTLTAPFKPVSAGFAPLRDGAFLPLKETMRAAFRGKFQHQTLVVEIASQLRAFVTAFGRPPDFIDGHQHVHLLPHVRDAVLTVVTEVAPQAWVRQCGSAVPVWQRLFDRKGLFIGWLSRRLRRRARELGVRTNPAFAGTYDFTAGADYARLFPKFLDGLPDGSVVMCHPGKVDDELMRLDSLTTLREREYAYFSGDEFPRVLDQRDVTLT
jgi:chitin disaccharide deacetylase